jgi:hydroxyethylthiazole kinase-like uncharacterized protein yjeF
LKIASAKIMRAIDSFCINSLGIPGIVLMENAALKVLKNIDFNSSDSFCVVCSKGNNGGDGFAVARHLYVLGKDVEVFLIGIEEGMSSDCRINYEAALAVGIKMFEIKSDKDMDSLKSSLLSSQVVVDAIFGTGLVRKIEGIYDKVITLINESKKHVIAIDIPSGMDCDTGNVLGNCIKADSTVTFQLFKKGFFKYGADEYTGKVILEEIGIPPAAVEKFHEKEYFLDVSMIRKIIKKRDKYSHKGNFGRVLIISGSKGYSGAAYISTQSAVRSGAGLVTLSCHEDIQDILCSKLTEAMTSVYSDRDSLNELIDKSDAIAIGPGMGNSAETRSVLKNVLSRAHCPVVIDADGINVLENNVDLLLERKCPVILTPHPGEMSRLAGYGTDYIIENRMEVAREFAEKHNLTVLLKGYNTIITNGDKLYVNSTGNSSMASGGMGDCLTGIIVSFIAQGYETTTAAYLAAFIHGYAGEKLSENMSCVNAEHLIEYLPYIIFDIVAEKSL